MYPDPSAPYSPEPSAPESLVPPPMASMQSPFAPVTHDPKEDEINWEGRHVHLKPKWHQKEKVGKAIGKGILTLAVVGVGATAFAAVAFTAKAAAVIATVVTLAISTVVLAILGIVMLKKSYWNDPKFRIRKEQQAMKDIVDNQLSYPKIRSKYKKKLISDEDLNKLLREPIRNGDYHTLISHHGKEFLKILDETNREQMKRHLQSVILDRNLGIEVAKKHFATDIKYLELTDSDLEQLLMRGEIEQFLEGKFGYGDLKKRNGERVQNIGPVCDYLQSDFSVLSFQDFIAKHTYAPFFDHLIDEIQVEKLKNTIRASLPEYPTFEALVGSYSIDAFNAGLIERDNVYVKAIVVDYLQRTSYNAANWQSFATLDVQEAIKVAIEKEGKATKKNKKTISHIETLYSDTVKDAGRVKKETIARSQNNYDQASEALIKMLAVEQRREQTLARITQLEREITQDPTVIFLGEQRQRMQIQASKKEARIREMDSCLQEIARLEEKQRQKGNLQIEIAALEERASALQNRRVRMGQAIQVSNQVGRLRTEIANKRKALREIEGMPEKIRLLSMRKQELERLSGDRAQIDRIDAVITVQQQRDAKVQELNQLRRAVFNYPMQPVHQQETQVSRLKLELRLVKESAESDYRAQVSRAEALKRTTIAEAKEALKMKLGAIKQEFNSKIGSS